MIEERETVNKNQKIVHSFYNYLDIKGVKGSILKNIRYS